MRLCVCVTGAGVPQCVQLPLHRDLRGRNDDEGNHNKTHNVSEHFTAKLILLLKSNFLTGKGSELLPFNASHHFSI